MQLDWQRIIDQHFMWMEGWWMDGWLGESVYTYLVLSAKPFEVLMPLLNNHD